MLMLGLVTLSWLKVNLKKKTENGHCHNPIHRATETNKSASCPTGSKFSQGLIQRLYINIGRFCK